MKIFGQILLPLLFSVSSIAWAEEQVIQVPGEGWHIRFEAPRLVAVSGQKQSVFYGSADRFQLSFFVEPPHCSGPDTDENIYACFLPKLLNNPYIVKDTVRANTKQNGVQVMALSRVEMGGGVGTNFSMHLLFARNGKWADVHASFASPTKADAKTLSVIMDSIKVEDDPVPKDLMPSVLK